MGRRLGQNRRSKRSRRRAASKKAQTKKTIRRRGATAGRTISRRRRSRGLGAAQRKAARARNQRNSARTRAAQISLRRRKAAQSKSRVQMLRKQTSIAKQSFGSRAGVGRAKGAARKSTSIRIGAATLRAQQQLSDKFGVTTFGLRGQLSTVPTITSGGFSDINVGFGRFSDINALAQAAITKQVAIEVTQRQRTGSGITISDGIISPTASLDAPIAVSDLREPNRIFSGFNEQGQPQFDGKSEFNIDKIFDNLPLIGAAFVGILLVMRLIKKI